MVIVRRMMSYIKQTSTKKKPSAHSSEIKTHKRKRACVQDEGFGEIQRKYPRQSGNNIQVDTNVQGEGFGEI